MKQNDATLRQIAAADPDKSTWLSANAGSGKTRVLTDRVARLLLGGVPPQNILCLTYTKAAATEMQNRLFDRLGRWAMKDDDALRDELGQLGASVPKNSSDLAHARTLFASALETPGGLRIQTIHSFCASLLRRFPLEAGVSPMFAEMDERAAAVLRDETIDDMANDDGAAALTAVSRFVSGDGYADLSKEVVHNLAHFDPPVGKAEIWESFGLAKDFGLDELLKSVFLGSESKLIEKVAEIMAASESTTDRGNAEKLTGINVDSLKAKALEKLIPMFVFHGETKTNPLKAKTNAFPTKAVQKNHPEIVSKLHEFMVRIEHAREPFYAFRAAEKTAALHQFANEFLPRYGAKKDARAWMDFDDLIHRARKLLSNPVVAQWVLFRLDGGLDHILIDEAQDTNPEQWQIVQLLAQEFTAGIGARTDTLRTIFVVGDLKQSIYSFQGADPGAFERMREHFDDNLSHTGQTLYQRSLEHSFRSSKAVLDVVDSVFATQNNIGLGGSPSHQAFHNDMPGRVDLWPLVPVSDKADDKNWFDPTDKPAANDHNLILAETIANQIQSMVIDGSIPDENGSFRKIRYDDFLVLVQSRSPLFHHIIRACKSLELPIAGADRLKIAAELAVKDIRALLAFLSFPMDDLSLACALRSPLFGLSEADLFDLAQPRKKATLWSSLRQQKDRFAEPFEILQKLLGKTDFLNPYELLEQVLIRHGGRDRLVARLGPEAEVGIDAILSLALEFERVQTPSLTGFIIWLDADDVVVKRQTDSAGGRIRVMTTHGAKGLESPIVILPDTGDRTGGRDPELALSKAGIPQWRVAADQRPAAMDVSLSREKEKQTEERQRLLYVALTRAEKWLILCGSGKIGPKTTSWYRQVEAGMAAVGSVDLVTPVGPGTRYQHNEWQPADLTSAPIIEPLVDDLPDWALTPAPKVPRGEKTVSPSDLGGDHSLDMEGNQADRQAALTWGAWIHQLLETLPDLPEDQWHDAARFLLANSKSPASESQFQSVFDEASRLLSDPNLESLFATNTLAEVDISADLSAIGLGKMHGVIDRLVVNDDRVLVVDFKSNRSVPDHVSDVPQGILRQLGAYLSAIKLIFPNSTIELAVLWTADGSLMSVPHDTVIQALHSIPHLDVPPNEP